MPSAVRLREDYSAAELRALARRSKNVNQSRRLLSWLRTSRKRRMQSMTARQIDCDKLSRNVPTGGRVPILARLTNRTPR